MPLIVNTDYTNGRRISDMSNAIKAVVCDFDGTFSTLRCGWEAVMKRMMMKYDTWTCTAWGNDADTLPL